MSPLPGYAVETSAKYTFRAASTDWIAWRVPANKVVVGARIISAHSIKNDFEFFRRAGPSETIGGYTFGPNDYGWISQLKPSTSERVDL